MNDTDGNKQILFDPYAILEGIDAQISIFGLVEKHHTSPETNFYTRPTLKGLKQLKFFLLILYL